MQTCQVFDCEEDSFVPSFALTDVIDNEIEFHEQVFPQSGNSEIQNELDSESDMLLDNENDILIESGGNIEIVRQNTTTDTLNNKFSNFQLKTTKPNDQFGEKNPLTENNTSIETDLPTENDPPVTESENRKVYWRKCRNIECKSEKLERIIQLLSSPVKLPVCRKVFQDTSCFEHVICKGLINYLRQLWDTKQYLQFYNILYQVHGEELIEDPDFFNWLSSELNIRSHHFIDYVKKLKRTALKRKG